MTTSIGISDLVLDNPVLTNQHIYKNHQETQDISAIASLGVKI